MPDYEVHYATGYATTNSYGQADRLARTVGGSIFHVTREPVPSTMMPTGDLPGWRQVLAEDFTRPVPVGGFVANQQGVLMPAGVDGYQAYGAGRVGGNELRAYPDGWNTTHKTSFYAPSKTLSVRDDVAGADGVLDIHHHTSTPRGGTVAKPLAAAVWFPLAAYSGAFRIGPFVRAEYRMRTTGWNRLNPTNYHVVPLFIGSPWPAKGEIDYAEGDAAEDAPVRGWYHRADPNGSQEQILGPDGAVMGDWHVYTIEWTPTEVRFYLDWQLIKTATVMVPQDPMAFVLQFEATSTAPESTTAGHVQIDWVTLYSHQP